MAIHGLVRLSSGHIKLVEDGLQCRYQQLLSVPPRLLPLMHTLASFVDPAVTSDKKCGSIGCPSEEETSFYFFLDVESLTE
jgi:hypothetical protein